MSSPTLEFEIRLDDVPDRREALRLRDELRDVLRDAGAARVTEVDVGDPEPGRRSTEVQIIGVIVSFVGSMVAVIQLLQAWYWRKAQLRGPLPCVTLRIDGVTLVISDPPTEAELRLIRELIERYDGREVGDRD